MHETRIQMQPTFVISGFNSMEKLALIVLVILCASLAFVIWLILRSTEGDEDDRGFHYQPGKPASPPTSEEAKRQEPPKTPKSVNMTSI